MTRAQRRLNSYKAKTKAKFVLHLLGVDKPTAKQVGRASAMHNTCPCWMCTHQPTNDPVRYKNYGLTEKDTSWV